MPAPRTTTTEPEVRAAAYHAARLLVGAQPEAPQRLGAQRAHDGEAALRLMEVQGHG